MTDIRQQLQAAFEIEHREHLQAIRRALDGADPSAIDLADVFRRAHSLKGAARAVDLAAVEEIAHRLEALFARVMDGERHLDQATIADVRASLDAIEDIVAGSRAPDGGPAPQTPDQGPGSPAPGDAPPVAAALSPAGPERGRAATPDRAAPVEPGTYLRVAAEQMEELSGSMHQLLTELQAGESLDQALRQIESDARGLRRSWEALQARIVPAGSSEQRRVSPGAAQSPGSATARLRDFDQDLKALFRRLSALARDRKQSSWAVDQAARRLRGNVDRVSLVAAETVFGGFGPMVREIARTEGRDVAVRTLGLDLQADRQVLQALKDPVMHLLRNAVSHGIEPAGERAAKGKSERGEVVLEMVSRGGRLVVSVRDDGRGPDLARIEQVAVERGLLASRGGDAMPPLMDQLLPLVFMPGFSTAAEVDHLSGRGMGLSVVAEAVRKLHGSVLMRPRYPWGSEILLNVPFTAARQSLLLVEAEDRMYGLPSHAVGRLLRLPAASLESVEGRPAARIDIGGKDVVVPVIPIAALTGSPDAQISIEAGHVKAVLIRHGSRHCALAVNAFHDVRPLLVSDAQAVGLPDVVSGTVLLEDEMPALVLSPDLLIEHWVRNESRLAAGGLGLSPEAQDAVPAATTILVVDDSITTRTLEKSILEAQGYRVLLSVDGVDALNVLRSGEAVVDLVIADVEMPRMDGFGLLQAIRTDPRIAPTPVILMTSRADPQDVRRGLDLGASAYITKQRFDQRELLATIGQLL